MLIDVLETVINMCLFCGIWVLVAKIGQMACVEYIISLYDRSEFASDVMDFLKYDYERNASLAWGPVWIIISILIYIEDNICRFCCNYNRWLNRDIKNDWDR